MSVILRIIGEVCHLSSTRLSDLKCVALFVVTVLAMFNVLPPPPPTEAVNLALMRCPGKALCYCWPGKSYSPYLKTCEVDSPVNLLWLSVKSPFSRAVSYPFGTCPLLDGLLLSYSAKSFFASKSLSVIKLCEVRLRDTSISLRDRR